MCVWAPSPSTHMSGLDELARGLVESATARDWISACRAAEALAQQQQQLTLGSWRLPFATAVVSCAEASQAEHSSALADSTSIRKEGERQVAKSLRPGGVEKGSERLCVASMRLLASWFALLVRYRRQHPSARLTAATSAIIFRSLNVALTSSQWAVKPHGADSAGAVGADRQGAPAAGVEESACGPEVVTAAVGALGAGLELMDATRRLAAQDAGLAAIESLAPGPSRPHFTLDNTAVNDLLSGWVHLVAQVCVCVCACVCVCVCMCVCVWVWV